MIRQAIRQLPFAMLCVALLMPAARGQDTRVDVDVPVAQYQALFNQRLAEGYAPIDVSASDTGHWSSALFQVIWQKGRTGWVATHNQTSAGYQSWLNGWLAAGLTPWYVESYGTYPNERYVALWGPAFGQWTLARHGMTSASFQSEWNGQAPANTARSIGASGSGANRRFSAIWERATTGGIAFHDRSRSNFEALVAGNPTMRLTELVSYGTEFAPQFAGILTSAGSIVHESRLGMTRSEFDLLNRDFELRGWRIRVIDAHGTGSNRRYDASWEQLTTPTVFSANGPTDPSLAAFDTTIEQHMRARGITRGSLAVMRDGRLVHSRGYTLAPAGTVTTKPNDMFRIANVSQPLTALGIMKLVEEGRLGLNDLVAPLLGLSGMQDARWNQMTVDHLLTHTGGTNIRRWFDPLFRDQQISSTLGVPLPIATSDIIDYMVQTQNLSHTPGSYTSVSNFGYCLLGRVIEQVTGRDYEDWMLDEVLSPLGLGSMRTGSSLLDGAIANEVNYVDTTGTTWASVMGPGSDPMVEAPYGRFNLENMDSTLGWVGSAADLVRFAGQIDPNRPNPILSQIFTNGLWLRPQHVSSTSTSWWSRGWVVEEVPGTSRTEKWISGSLDGTYSFLLKGADGVDIAVVFNQRSSSSLPPSADIHDELRLAAASVTSWPTHDLRTSAGNVTTSGRACGGASGAPWIRLGGGTQPILGQTFRFEVENVPAASAPVLFYAFQNQTWAGQALPIPLDSIGAPGCSIYLPPVEFVPVPNAGGRIDISVPVGTDPSLVGFEYFIQFLVPDPSANAAGAAVSNLARIRLGSH